MDSSCLQRLSTTKKDFKNLVENQLMYQHAYEESKKFGGKKYALNLSAL